MVRFYAGWTLLCFFVFPRFGWAAHDLLETGRFGPPLRAEVLVDVVSVAHARAGVADELPTDEAGVAAVHGVREHAFDGVGAEELEEMRFLDRLELLDLWIRGELVEIG